MLDHRQLARPSRILLGSLSTSRSLASGFAHGTMRLPLCCTPIGQTQGSGRRGREVGAMDDSDLFADDGEDAEAATLTQQALVGTQQNLGKMLDIMPIGLLFIPSRASSMPTVRHAACFRPGPPRCAVTTYSTIWQLPMPTQLPKRCAPLSLIQRPPPM